MVCVAGLSATADGLFPAGADPTSAEPEPMGQSQGRRAGMASGSIPGRCGAKARPGKEGRARPWVSWRGTAPATGASTARPVSVTRQSLRIGCATGTPSLGLVDQHRQSSPPRLARTLHRARRDGLLGPGMRFGILGSLDIADNGHQLALGGRKQRTLLAVLLLHAGEAVPRDRLIEAIWDGRPPPSADVSLDTYVHRLRKLLGPERITRRSGGYAIHVEPEELDSNRFEQLIEEA